MKKLEGNRSRLLHLMEKYPSAEMNVMRKLRVGSFGKNGKGLY